MSTHQDMKSEMTTESTNLSEAMFIIKEHINTLIYPMDSWLEGNLIDSNIYFIKMDSEVIGYAGIQKDCLRYFYIRRHAFKRGPEILEKIVEAHQLKSIFVMTQDQLLVTLVSEWNYEINKDACFFTDAQLEDEPNLMVGDRTFRTANLDDVTAIRQVAKDFFDDVSCGFNSLEERIEAGTIFVLEEGQNPLGYGIVEKSNFDLPQVSIGMFVDPAFRKKGAARHLLLHLKRWAYGQQLTPVAGCWYYNTLSRKSLESAGMIASAMGYEAILKGKEKLPLLTGNPPGELVEPIIDLL